MDDIVSAEDVLRIIEKLENVEMGSLWIDRGEVWRRDDSGDLKSMCLIGSDSWQAYRAAELAYRVLVQAKGSAIRFARQDLDRSDTLSARRRF